MAQYTEDVTKQLLWEVPFKRTKGFPIDRSQVFTSYDEAMNYVKGIDDSKGKPYIGQILSVSTEDSLTVYKVENIGADGVLTEIEGKKPIAGDGIDIDNNTISVKISNINNQTNFITMDDNGIAVTEMSADKTIIRDKIPVAGGPLADLLNKAGINEIDANTDMNTFLFKLLCEEKYPTSVSFTEGEIKSNLSQPSFSLTPSDAELECGSKVTMSKITIPSVATPQVTKARRFNGFTYGYSFEDDNQKDSSNTSKAAVETNKTLNSGEEYTMKCEFSGFNNQTALTSTNSTTYSEVTIDSIELMIDEGTNKVKATITGPSASVDFGEIPELYACSNIGKTRSGSTVGDGVYYKTEKKDAVTKSSIASSNNKEITVTGKRFMFWGANKEHLTLNSANIRSLANGGTCATTALTATIYGSEEGVSQFVIAIPSDSGYSLTSAKNVRAMGDETFNSFTTEVVNVEGANGYTAKAYNIWKLNAETATLGTDAAFEITITKNA